MNRVLVTGATGFIGGHLVQHALDRGSSVVAASRRLTATLRREAVTWAELDLSRPDAFARQVFAGVECVFHLAARVHVLGDRARNEEQFYAENVAATFTLAQQAAAAGVRRFILLSSIKVNGERTERDRPFTAEHAPAPLDPYGRSKWQAERALLEVAASSGMDAVIVRPPLVYGPGVVANFRKLLTLAYANVPLPLAAIRNQRSLISVWNLVDWLWHAGTEPNATGRVWLVSDGHDFSTPALIESLGRAFGRRPRLWKLPVPWLRLAGSIAGRRAEIDRLVDSLQVDIAETRMAMRWTPPLSAEEGIARTAAWYAEQRRATD